MAHLIPLDQSFCAGSEIHTGDVAALATAGFRTLICFRPDGEAPDQTPFHAIAEAAAAHGLQATHIPVQPGMLDQAAAHTLQARLALLPAPAYGYCKSGVRAATIWALAQHGRPAIGGLHNAALALHLGTAPSQNDRDQPA